MLGTKVKTFFVICQEASSRFALICFPLAACKFFFSPIDFFFSYKIFFVTKFVTLVTKFLTHVTKFVIHVTNFVTNFFCADSKKYLGLGNKLIGFDKKYPPRNSGRTKWSAGLCSTKVQVCDGLGFSTIHSQPVFNQ